MDTLEFTRWIEGKKVSQPCEWPEYAWKKVHKVSRNCRRSSPSSQPSKIEPYTFRGKGPCFISLYPQHHARCPSVSIYGIELIVQFSMKPSTQWLLNKSIHWFKAIENNGNLGYNLKTTEPETIRRRGHLAKSLLSQMNSRKAYEVKWPTSSFRSHQRHSRAETKATIHFICSCP